MMAPAVGNGTLARMSRLETDGERVLSLYLDLDASRFPTPEARDTQLRALLAQARREDGAADAERVEALVRDDPALLRGVPGLAIFSCSAAGILETVRLPSAVEPMAVLDTLPWLEPLVPLVGPEAWGVAVVSRDGARLLRGGPRTLVEFATVHDDVHGRHDQGGWSQARYQRGIEEQVAVHVRHVAERLLRAHRRQPFTHLVLVADDELGKPIRAQLDPQLAAVLAGWVHADLVHATVQEIVATVVPVIEQTDRERERALIAQLEAGLGTAGHAAAGLDEVLATLHEDRVATLLLAPGAEPAHAVEQAIELAVGQAADVAYLRYETEPLAHRGGIAALLRW